jgi:hypothetical protein
MVAGNYYRVSALPTLGDLGTVPPLSPADLVEHVADGRRPRLLIEALLLFDDLVQREAYLAGEVRSVWPAVLAPGQVRSEQPLPDYLAAEEEPSALLVSADAVWAAYFRHAAATAERLGSPFLAEWVSHEVSLRNALVAARARALGLDPAHYLVEPDLGRSDEDFGPVISEWAQAPDPLAGLRVLDRARWTWLTEHDGWFTFADDELAAYAAKLILLIRWQRINTASSGAQKV